MSHINIPMTPRIRDGWENAMAIQSIKIEPQPTTRAILLRSVFFTRASK